MFRSILALLKVYADMQLAINGKEPFHIHRSFDMGKENLNVSIAGVLSENRDPDAPEFTRFDNDLFFHLIGLTADLNVDENRDGIKDTATREYSIYIAKDDPATPEDDPIWLNVRVDLQLLRG